MIPCIFNLGTGEVIVLLTVVLLLFGARRIPQLARSIGQGIRSFRQGLNDVADAAAADDNTSDTRQGR